MDKEQMLTALNEKIVELIDEYKKAIVNKRIFFIFKLINFFVLFVFEGITIVK